MKCTDMAANTTSGPELGAAKECRWGLEDVISELMSRNYRPTQVQLPRNVSSDEHGSRPTEEGRSRD